MNQRLIGNNLQKKVSLQRHFCFDLFINYSLNTRLCVLFSDCSHRFRSLSFRRGKVLKTVIDHISESFQFINPKVWTLDIKLSVVCRHLSQIKCNPLGDRSCSSLSGVIPSFDTLMSDWWPQSSINRQLCVGSGGDVLKLPHYHLLQHPAAPDSHKVLVSFSLCVFKMWS